MRNVEIGTKLALMPHSLHHMGLWTSAHIHVPTPLAPLAVSLGVVWVQCMTSRVVYWDKNILLGCHESPPWPHASKHGVSFRMESWKGEASGVEFCPWALFLTCQVLLNQLCLPLELAGILAMMLNGKWKLLFVLGRGYFCWWKI